MQCFAQSAARSATVQQFLSTRDEELYSSASLEAFWGISERWTLRLILSEQEMIKPARQFMTLACISKTKPVKHKITHAKKWPLSGLLLISVG
jgi:hypothetical protein